MGRHAVAEALANQPQRAGELLLVRGRRSRALEEILARARELGLKVRRVEPARLEALAGGAAHQGVALRLAAASYTPLDRLLDDVAQAGPRALVVMADHLEDPHNLGALLRSAAAAGAQGVIIPKDRACPLTPAVAKAAAGALSRLPVCRVTNLAAVLEELKQCGLWALAAATRGAPPPWELDLDRPLVLVVGAEHRGISPRLRRLCDMAASLPLAPGSESLNASVAAGVLLFEIVRQRG